MIYVGIGLAGFLGAIARFWLGQFIARKANSPFPWGTFLINVSGAFVLGLFFGLGTAPTAISPNLRLALGTGFLGAYTTFSTWTLETHRLVRSRAYLVAAANVILSAIFGLLAAAAGMAVSRSLFGV